ncbi:MAG: ABC transporter ATP-binding protein [Clostridiales bacterium]|jgi:branched-chain amino acid transport system ATP-binding protein|nr:ABC transporter ATP-binding protein [Clostridiales bacterium]MCK9350175.1 ABC transporter ATP-binding protein [Clostridiales bacterium]MDD2572042.1 ABC transporter ATP-binding protein [Eubacteriales bacterium]MDD4186382.1 ABC transporter ATP-binding protein [Eubacteriales bacterium]NLG30228.1 ABC transporter ATP-binding protein [Clostridiaceae bacterium]
MLKVRDLSVYYDAIQAVKRVSFDVSEGEIVSLIGANGAGKTTILHTISGLIRPEGGSIRFDGADITQKRADKIPGLGLAQVPEGRRVFARMSVSENLEMGAYSRKDDWKEDYEHVLTLLPRLRERRNQLAGTLSGGEQQMLAIGRALMSKPKMLLLDEPSMGLSPLLVGEVFRLIREINAEGMTILLVEQNAKIALTLASRGYVLETGRITLYGNTSDLIDNEEVKRAYLGGATHP